MHVYTTGSSQSVTTMKAMSHPVRCLSPPPDIALELIGQTTLGLPASRPIETRGSNKHGSVHLMPCRSCKNQSILRKFATDDNRKVYQIHTCMVVCIVSVQCLHNICTSLHKVCIIHLVHTWHEPKKSARDAHLYASMHHFC